MIQVSTRRARELLATVCEGGSSVSMGRWLAWPCRPTGLQSCNALDMANEALDIADKLSLFTEHWSPKVVARLNDYEIKVVKLQGEFVWHTHEDTDELFLRRAWRADHPAAGWGCHPQARAALRRPEG